jgi:hypothetical protein
MGSKKTHTEFYSDRIAPSFALRGVFGRCPIYNHSLSIAREFSALETRPPTAPMGGHLLPPCPVSQKVFVNTLAAQL